MTRLARWAFLIGLVAPHVAQADPSPLRLDEVMESVTVHDPRIRKAVEDLRRAEGNTMEARGAFDPRLKGDAALTTGAYYDLREADAELRQATTLWGSEIYAGYRVGRGVNQRWPTYFDNQTLSGGEVRAGIEIPIWRNGLIDEARARRARALELEDAARSVLDSTALDLEVAAASAYWKWVSAGQTSEVTKALLDLAEQRDSQLRRRLAAGSIAEFDITDNERILLERRALLVTAQRGFEQAAFELSLFLRDEQGRSIVPAPERLPAAVSLGDDPDLSEDAVIDQVLACHPEVERVRAELRAFDVDVRLTKNQLAPELEAAFEYSRDLGQLTGTDLDFTLPGNVFEAGIQLSMPLLFRDERGRASAARAKAAAQRAEVRFIEDQLRARVRDAASAVRAARERVRLNAELVETAATLSEGERRRFDVGSSNLIFVNLREQQAALARVRLIEALAVAEIEQVRWTTTTGARCR
ncbi:MAG: TolC family protein [Myxococcales bacterium]|nr:TolC family protein [Myxococcales bacterium]MDH3484079.1 TolC family protein [Myxococcales bacterium]